VFKKRSRPGIPSSDPEGIGSKQKGVSSVFVLISEFGIGIVRGVCLITKKWSIDGKTSNSRFAQ